MKLRMTNGTELFYAKQWQDKQNSEVRQLKTISKPFISIRTAHHLSKTLIGEIHSIMSQVEFTADLFLEQLAVLASP